MIRDCTNCFSQVAVRSTAPRLGGRAFENKLDHVDVSWTRLGASESCLFWFALTLSHHCLVRSATLVPAIVQL